MSRAWNPIGSALVKTVIHSNCSIRHRSLSKKREQVHVRRRSQSADRVLQAQQAGLIETYSSEGEGTSEKEEPSDPLQAPSANTGSTDRRESPPTPTEPDSSLMQIFPAMYGEDYKELQLMDRTVEIFLQCLGVRGSLQMGNTQFRNFTRYHQFLVHPAMNIIDNYMLIIVYSNFGDRIIAPSSGPQTSHQSFKPASLNIQTAYWTHF